MINLIPPEGHRVIKHEYLLRVWATVLTLLGGVAILITVSLIPTYVLLTSQMHAFAVEEKQAQEKDAKASEAEKELRLTSVILGQLKTSSSSILASEAIAEIQKRTSSDIIFVTFAVEEANGLITKINVQGKASTREALARLKESIESSDMFETVEVPIADLAHQTDLPFTIGITLAKKK